MCFKGRDFRKYYYLVKQGNKSLKNRSCAVFQLFFPVFIKHPCSCSFGFNIFSFVVFCGILFCGFLWFFLISFNFLASNGGGKLPSKKVDVLTVSLGGINHRLWSHLG